MHFELTLRADVGIVHERIFPTPLHDYSGAAALVEAALNSTIHCAESGACEMAAKVMGGAVVSDSKAAMEFLPLMMTSLYCALGIVWAWLRLSWVYMTT